MNNIFLQQWSQYTVEMVSVWRHTASSGLLSADSSVRPALMKNLHFLDMNLVYGSSTTNVWSTAIAMAYASG